jgi:hypothetical protein
MYLRTCRSLNSTNRIGSTNRITQITTFAEIRKYNVLFNSANLRIFDLRNLFVDHPPLVIDKHE